MPTAICTEYTRVLPAVVLVLSEAFIGRPYPMAELQLLLDRRQQHPSCEALLVPCFFGVKWEDVNAKANKYKTKCGNEQSEAQWRQWARDLAECLSMMEVDDEKMAEKQRNLEAAAEDDSRRGQWAKDLGILKRITGLRTDQVGGCAGWSADMHSCCCSEQCCSVLLCGGNAVGGVNKPRLCTCHPLPTCDVHSHVGGVGE
jgi:hypothetical protein